MTLRYINPLLTITVLKAGADAQLFILFGSSTDVSSSSALCVYSMHDIVRDFVRAQTDCYLGHGELVDWIVSTYSPCQRDVSILILLTIF